MRYVWVRVLNLSITNREGFYDGLAGVQDYFERPRQQRFWSGSSTCCPQKG